MQTDISILTDRELDRQLAEALGYNVVADDWPCWLDIETGCYMPYLTRQEAITDAHPGDVELPVYVVDERGWPPDARGVASVSIVPFYSTDPAASDGLLDDMKSRGWDRMEAEHPTPEGEEPLTGVNFDKPGWPTIQIGRLGSTRLRARAEAAYKALVAEKAAGDENRSAETHS